MNTRTLTAINEIVMMGKIFVGLSSRNGNMIHQYHTFGNIFQRLFPSATVRKLLALRIEGFPLHSAIREGNAMVKALTSVLLAIAAAGAVWSMQEKTVDFGKAVAEKNREYRADSFVNSEAGLLDLRSRSQDVLLQEFERCPDCFVRKYTGAQRTFLFDAIADCPSALRVGTPFDGGKWVCSPQTLPAKPVVYSFGVGGNISFDMEMAGRFGAEVFMFDPSPSVVAGFRTFANGSACGRGHLSFQPIGLGPVADRPEDRWKLVIEGQACAVKSLAEIARQHNHARVDLLKMDIEGSEFPALKEMVASRSLLSLQVRQLLVEFHLINDQAFADFVRTIEALKKQGFLLFRKEFNPYAAATCAEYVFVRK
jgi:FkbM family methyltransferase